MNGDRLDEVERLGDVAVAVAVAAIAIGLGATLIWAIIEKVS
jgi:hypothetical protein